RTPGRQPLSANSDRILDVIAAAGGSSRSIHDVTVRIQRGGQTYAAPMSIVTTQFNENVRLQRGDQVNLVYQPRRFSSFGAFNAVARTDLPPGPLTLAEALSGVGGLDSNLADAKSVLIFRFERPEVAQALGIQQPATPRGVPVVYRLNLNEGSGFFIASNFQIEPDDIIYAPRAGAAEARKFFEFVQSVTRVIYDVSVTSAINID
ncbi:MAG TPA: polysaccharide export protein, partial [Brevundimonas sp.]|nr:polysaccharide export protein [Brevundimonas sp.]